MLLPKLGNVGDGAPQHTELVVHVRQRDKVWVDLGRRHRRVRCHHLTQIAEQVECLATHLGRPSGNGRGILVQQRGVRDVLLRPGPHRKELVLGLRDVHVCLTRRVEQRNLGKVHGIVVAVGDYLGSHCGDFVHEVGNSAATLAGCLVEHPNSAGNPSEVEQLLTLLLHRQRHKHAELGQGQHRLHRRGALPNHVVVVDGPHLGPQQDRGYHLPVHIFKLNVSPCLCRHYAAVNVVHGCGGLVAHTLCHEVKRDVHPLEEDLQLICQEMHAAVILQSSDAFLDQAANDILGELRFTPELCAWIKDHCFDHERREHLVHKVVGFGASRNNLADNRFDHDANPPRAGSIVHMLLRHHTEEFSAPQPPLDTRVPRLLVFCLLHQHTHGGEAQAQGKPRAPRVLDHRCSRVRETPEP
eukprot:m.30357 g.30357  ORF g.30357 m.30357 type:complete len:413 (+) comp12221_c0_seq1:1108-2346(+)